MKLFVYLAITALLLSDSIEAQNPSNSTIPAKDSSRRGRTGIGNKLELNQKAIRIAPEGNSSGETQKMPPAPKPPGPTAFQASCGTIAFNKPHKDAYLLPFRITQLPEYSFLNGFDDGNNFSNSTYTIPSDGVYHFDVAFDVVWLTGGVHMFLTRLPNRVVGSCGLQSPNAGATLSISATGKYKKGDQLQVSLRAAADAFGDPRSASSQWSGFKVY